MLKNTEENTSVEDGDGDNQRIIESVCDEVLAVEDICHETDNTTILTSLMLENVYCDESKTHCVRSEICWSCELNFWRNDLFTYMKLDETHTFAAHIHDHRGWYTRSHWIFADKIDGKIPGFLLVKCTGAGVDENMFTHELVFACVRPEFRRRGILRNMLIQLPKEWSIWLEASSNDVRNVEKIWEKCGFTFHENIHGHLVYKSLPLGETAN